MTQSHLTPHKLALVAEDVERVGLQQAITLHKRRVTSRLISVADRESILDPIRTRLASIMGRALRDMLDNKISPEICLDTMTMAMENAFIDVLHGVRQVTRQLPIVSKEKVYIYNKAQSQREYMMGLIQNALALNPSLPTIASRIGMYTNQCQVVYEWDYVQIVAATVAGMPKVNKKLTTGTPLTKYSPDQPRAANGEFGSGGGTGITPGPDFAKDEVEALQAYKGNEYSAINSCFRNTGMFGANGPPSITLGWADSIDKAEASHTLSSDTTVYRSMTAEALPSGIANPQGAVGMEFKDEGFPSTSMDKDQGLVRSYNGIVTEIHVPAGTHAIDLSEFEYGKRFAGDLGSGTSGEKELLLDRGLTYHIDSVSTINTGGSVKPYLVLSVVPGSKSTSLGSTTKATGSNRFVWNAGDIVWSSSLTKYSPDQPRAANGEFGSGGESASAVPRGRLRVAAPSMDESTYDTLDSIAQSVGMNPHADAQNVKAQVAKDIAQRMGDKYDAQLIPASTLEGIRTRTGYVRTFPNGTIEYSKTSGVGTPYEADEKIGEREISASDPKALTSAREAGVGRLVSQWAQTSNDSDTRSLAMQEAAKAEFGLTGTAGWYSATQPDSSILVSEEIEKNGSMYQAFLRAQYEHTQLALRDAGVKEMTLYRGMKLPSGTTIGNVEVSTRPMNAFSVGLETAQSFGTRGGNPKSTGYIASATVPADRILSTAYTGVGCKAEGEIVVLGGKDTVNLQTTYSTLPDGNGPPDPTIAGLFGTKMLTKAQTIVADDERNEDWIKTLSWDLPTTVRGLTQGEADPVAYLTHLKTLPCYEAVPALLNTQIDAFVAANVAKGASYAGKSAENATSGVDKPTKVADYVSKGCMIALVPSEAISKQIVDLFGEDQAEELHITLVYLGMLDEDDIQPDQTIAIVKQWAAQTSPISGEYNGHCLFATDQGDGKVPEVITLDSPTVAADRTKLVDMLTDAGIGFKNNHGFIPHTTVGYVDPDTSIKPLAKAIPVTFDAVDVFIGEEQTTIALSDIVQKYSPDQPRAANGEFGSGTGMSTGPTGGPSHLGQEEGNPSMFAVQEGGLSSGDNHAAAQRMIAAVQGDDKVFGAKLDIIGKQFGVNVLHGPIKSEARICQKSASDYQGSITDVRDAVRGTVFSDNPKGDKDAYLQAIRSQYAITRIKDTLGGPGYQDVKANVRLSSGYEAEIKIATPEMVEASEVLGGHDMYVSLASGKLPPDEYASTKTAMDALYAGAQAKTAARIAAKQ